jgi:hypothetical protein
MRSKKSSKKIKSIDRWKSFVTGGACIVLKKTPVNDAWEQKMTNQ